MSESAVLEPAIELDVTPAEIEAAIRALRERKRQEAEAAAIEEARRATGYPKVLYNPVYKEEQIAGPPLPNGKPSLHYLRFMKGALVVEDAETEAIIRQACGDRIYEADLSTAKVCPTCGFITRSSLAYERDVLSHL